MAKESLQAHEDQIRMSSTTDQYYRLPVQSSDADVEDIESDIYMDGGDDAGDVVPQRIAPTHRPSAFGSIKTDELQPEQSQFVRTYYYHYLVSQSNSDWSASGNSRVRVTSTL